MASVVQVSHPLVRHHLTRLRDQKTSAAGFRNGLQRLSSLLAYVATQDLDVREIEVDTPLTTTTGAEVKSVIALVPILRAGLGMVDPILDLIPDAEVWHLGIYRDEATALPVQYYCKIPPSGPVDVAMVLDPMLATGGSAIAAIETLQDWGVPKIKLLSVIAASAGVEAVTAQFPDLQLFVCAIDPDLNTRKFIVPGLGDAGDRAFNTHRAHE